DIHNVGDTVEALVPHVFNNHGSGKYSSGIRHQVLQQSVLFRGQLNPFARSPDLLGQAIEFQVFDAHHAAPVHRASPQQRLDPSQQLGERKGLGQVIVGASLEVPHLVRNCIPRGEHENGD